MGTIALLTLITVGALMLKNEEKPFKVIGVIVFLSALGAGAAGHNLWPGVGIFTFFPGLTVLIIQAVQARDTDAKNPFDLWRGLTTGFATSLISVGTLILSWLHFGSG